MKIVFGNVYFALESIDEIPDDIREVYERALRRLPFTFRHNVVKVSKDRQFVTLLYYPHLDTHAHPYLAESVLVPLNENLSIKRKIETRTNPVILHRVELLLSSSNPRRKYLEKLTKREEELGLFAPEHRPYIGRRRYWNNLCRAVGLEESIAPGEEPGPTQLELFDIASKIQVRRERTAKSGHKPSFPTRWAFQKGYIQPVVFDWGCGRGRDTIWLESQGIETIGYDPFYKPEPSPHSVDFGRVKTVLLNYVLNVIEDCEERIELLKLIQKLVSDSTIVLVSARSEKEIRAKAVSSQWRRYADGYITSRSTFQKGFSLRELVSLCSSIGEVIESLEFSGGVACVVSVTK